MSRRVPLNIIGESYADETQPFSSQDCVNCEPIPAETDGTRGIQKLRGTPGLTTFGTVGTGTVRGNVALDEIAYYVADTMQYSVASDGTATALGTIEGSGRVGIAENGIQTIVVNGEKAWTYTPGTSTFAEVTDADYSHSVDCCFVGGYIAHVEGDTDQWFISALSDATSYSSNDYASAESATDGLNGILALNNDVWLFGPSSIEVWQNTGAADFPFERISQIEKGLAATFAKAKLDNTIYWLGSNGIVYRAEGYSARRISKRPIEQSIASETLSEAFAFAYEDAGNAYFVLTFPSGKTWVYNVATGRWHRRKSFEMERWRANTYLFAYNKHLVGDTTQGKVWELDRSTFTEGTDPLVWERKSQFISADGEYLRAAELELEFDMGHGLTTGQGSAPLVDMCYSDDGGRNFTVWRQASLGLTGEYRNRARFHGLGRFRQRMFWIRISDPVPRDLVAATGKAAD
jgi:hypothetical protein